MNTLEKDDFFVPTYNHENVEQVLKLVEEIPNSEEEIEGNASHIEELRKKIKKVLNLMKFNRFCETEHNDGYVTGEGIRVYIYLLYSYVKSGKSTYAITLAFMSGGVSYFMEFKNFKGFIAMMTFKTISEHNQLCEA